MVEAFIDLDTSVKLMLTSRNHVILYDTLEYNSLLLDKLYKILSTMSPSSVIVVTHAIYDTSTYNDCYNVWSEQVGDYIYQGAVSQLDINKLMCVFSAAKIADVKLYDKMYMYQYFLENNQCIVDSNNGMYLLIAKSDTVKAISYSKKNMLDQTLLQICRKTNASAIKNFTTFIDYECVRWFENYGSVLELPIYVQMTVFGFFKFIKPELCFDINKVKFNSKLETVDYDSKVLKSVNSPAAKSATLSGENPLKKEMPASNQKTVETPNKKVKKVATKSNNKKKPLSVVLSAILIITIISLVGAFGVSYYYRQQVIEKSQELLIAKDDLAHKQLCLTKLQENIPTELAGILDTVNRCHPEYVVVGSVTIDNTIEVVYYMVDGNTDEELISQLSAEFNVNAVIDGGVITLDDQNYKKFSVSLSKR